jgi:hypothetical protein
VPASTRPEQVCDALTDAPVGPDHDDDIALLAVHIHRPANKE